jgi:hypothetical protein
MLSHPVELPNSGKGLYTKHNITVGTVFSEYRGTLKQLDGASGGDHDLFPYAVRVGLKNGTVMMIDGIDNKGIVLSLAPRANDAGPIYQNCILAEYSENPGKVFLEASRDIKAGEEIFVCYGADYWGIDNYPIFDSLEMYNTMPQVSCRATSLTCCSIQRSGEPKTQPNWKCEQFWM